MEQGHKKASKGRRCVFMADGANKWSICPANKGVIVCPEGNVKMLASYPSLGGGGHLANGLWLNSLLEIHAHSSWFTQLGLAWLAAPCPSITAEDLLA